MKVIHRQAEGKETTTVSLDAAECLDVFKRALEMPETKERAKEIALQFIEPKKAPSQADVFIADVLLLAEEFSTPTERKTIHRMVKRVRQKYDPKGA